MATDHARTTSAPSSTPSTIRENKDIIRAAATQLRHAATQDTYRGLQRPEHAYALASVLDMFELRWTDQDGPMREEVRRCCRTLLARDDDPGPGRQSADGQHHEQDHQGGADHDHRQRERDGA